MKVDNFLLALVILNLIVDLNVKEDISVVVQSQVFP